MGYIEDIKNLVEILRLINPTAIKDLFSLKKEIGLKKIYSRDDLNSKEVFEKCIDKLNIGDEVIIVGRTLKWIGFKKEGILQGLKKDKKMHFKLLYLDKDKLANGEMNTKMLDDFDVESIHDHLSSARMSFRKICHTAKQDISEYKGFFNVRKCDFIIPNSYTSFRGTKKRMSIFDFSFGTDIGDKYVLFFEHDSEDKSHFENRLYEFYHDLFKQGIPDDDEVQFNPKQS